MAGCLLCKGSCGPTECSKYGLLSRQTAKIVNSKFGISKLYNFQRHILQYTLFAGGRVGFSPYASDLCCYVPTGWGKTLAYLLPIVEYLSRSPKHPGLAALILLPTRELAEQVFECLQPFWSQRSPLRTRCAVLLNGSLPPQHERDCFSARMKFPEDVILGPLDVRGPDILVAVAGRLISHIAPFAREGDSFVYANLRFVIIDEADRLLEESYGDWLRALQKITLSVDRKRGLVSTGSDDLLAAVCQAAAAPVQLQKLIFTATPVNEGYQGFKSLRLLKPISLFGEVKGDSKLKQVLCKIEKSKEQESKAIVHIYKHLRHASRQSKILVFCRSVKDTARLKKEIEHLEPKLSTGILAPHAADRRKALNEFKSGDTKILLTIDIGSRGLHIEGVSAVVHVSPPSSGDTYIHRIGRTGRAGADGMSIVLYSSEEELMQADRIVKEANKHRHCNPTKCTLSDFC